jgi:hypothetical protein
LGTVAMSKQFAPNSFLRAYSGYEDAHRARLVQVISGAIAEASILTDVNVLAIRTGETADALVTVLAGVLALVPRLNTPQQQRLACEAIAKSLRQQLADARNDPVAQQMRESGGTP